MDFLHKVEAVVILDAQDGSRVYTKYFPIPQTSAAAASSSKTGAAGSAGGESIAADSTAGPWPTLEQQLKFEDNLHKKVQSQKGSSYSGAEDDIILIEGHTVLYHVDPELSFYVIGSGEENELVLLQVLNCLYDSLQQLTKASGPIDKRTLLESYDALLLVVDEMIDDSVILETGAGNVVQDVQPFTEQNSGEAARKALSNINKYLKQNL